jgi:hypothetical protein
MQNSKKLCTQLDEQLILLHPVQLQHQYFFEESSPEEKREQNVHFSLFVENTSSYGFIHLLLIAQQGERINLLGRNNHADSATPR